MIIQRTAKLACFVVLLVLMPVSVQVQVTLTADDTLGTSSFNTAGHWSDSLPPSVGKNYDNNDFLLRTPEGTSDHTFAGDSLLITSASAPART